MLLKHNNLTIRNATKDDAKKLANWWNDGSVMTHAGFPNGLGITAEEVAKSINRNNDHNRLLIIEIDDLAVGEMNYRKVGDGVAEIGIKICDSSKQNKGDGKVLLSMLIAELFAELGYQKIVLNTNVNNKRSQRVYEQLGFINLGVNENAWEDQMGELQHAVDYELYPTNFINFATE